MEVLMHLGEATRKRLILVACILGSGIVFVDSTVVNVALPAIQRDLGGGLVLQQWVVDAYLLTLGSLILVGGSLGDLFGGKRIFELGVLTFGLTSLLCALGLGGPVFALIESPKRGLADPLILVTLLGGIAMLAAFVWWELHHDAPMLPLRLFRLRNFTFANVETLAVYAALSTLTFFLVLFLQQLAGYSPLKSGLVLVPITIVMFLLSPRVGRLSMRHGPRLFMGAGPF